MVKPNLAQIFPEQQDDTGPVDGDGEGSDDSTLQSIQIDIALNGYTVTYVYDVDGDEKYVFTEFKDVLEQLRSKH